MHLPSPEFLARAADPASVVGVISDTHGLLRPQALAALAGCHLILHAGDLGKAGIFEQLSGIAPTVAVRGNVDRGTWAEGFPETLAFSISGVGFYVLHELAALTPEPLEKKVEVIIAGHSHHPVIKENAGVLYVNPGSAGPRRFSLPVTVARLLIGPDRIRADLIDVINDTVVATLTKARQISA